MKQLSKKQLFVTIIFSIIILFGISLCIPAIDNIIIHYVELFFHKTLRNPARWIDVIQNTSRLFIFTLCIIYYLAFIPKGVELSTTINKRFIEVKSNYYCKKTLIILFSLCLFLFIVYFNIIKSNYFYSDDIFRNYGGNRSWIGFSRYISEFGSIIIHNSLKLNDIAPFTQFISIFISSISIIILSISLTDSLKIKNLLALSIIFIAPFYAENISYRFDCPYMALSLFFVTIPFLFKDNKITFIFTSIIGLLLTSISYQAALSLYILCVIYLFAKNFFLNKQLKENIYFALYAILAFIVAMLIFKFFFMNKMSNDEDDYFSSAISISSLIPNIIEYIKLTFFLNGGLFSKFLFVSSLFLLLFNTLKIAEKKYYILIILVLLIVSYILSFGPYLIFERPVFASRAFMGFNVFISLVLLGNIELSSNHKNIKSISIFLTCATIYACTVFMFTYGNCLQNQKEYEDFRTKLILQDLSEYSEHQNKYNVSFKGTIGLCEKNRIALKNFPLIKQILPQRPSEHNIWNEEVLSVYNFKCTDKHTELSDNYQLLKKTYYHEIYKSDNNFIVVLK